MGYNSNMQKHVKDIFSDSQIDYINQHITEELSKREVYIWDEHRTGEKFPEAVFMDKTKYINNVSLGKIILELKLTDDIKETLVALAKNNGFDVDFFDATYTEYASKYGRPNLEAHKDYQNFCLIDYQLDSNTSWPLYIEDQEYDLKNNEGIIFVPSQLIHGRIEKEFADNEVVKMIFFDMKFKNEGDIKND